MRLGWALYGVSRRLHRRQFDLETLALLLATVGFAITAAWDPGALYKQLAAVALGMGIYCVLVWLLGRLQLAVKLRWPAAGLAAALLAFNVVMGERIFGAKNWISVGPISFQPSELVKLAFVLAGAATLDRLFAKRNLIFTVLFSAYCVGCLALMSDFGTALVFFVAFLCIAFLRTGDLASIVMMTAAAASPGAWCCTSSRMWPSGSPSGGTPGNLPRPPAISRAAPCPPLPPGACSARGRRTRG